MLNIKRHLSLPTYQTPQASAHAARSKSFQATLKTKSFAGPEQFATVMWKELMGRLHDNRVPVNLALLPVRHCSLHLESASPPQAAVFNKIIESPLETTDEEVRTVLPLEEATVDSPRQDRSHRFYIRSFSLTVKQLKDRLADWKENELFYAEAELWARAVEALTDEDFVFLRYVGTHGPDSSALGRFYEDLTQRSTGVFGAFFNTLAMLAPEVIDTAKVYKLTNATLQPLSVDLEVSQRERPSIALLDRRVLLSPQAGGFFATWTAPAADETVFVALKTKMLSEALFRISSFMDECPALTEQTRIQPSPGLKATMQAQTTPAMMSGKVLLLQPDADASDPAVQQTVIEQAVERLWTGWKEDPFSSEKQSKRRLGWRKTGGLVETLRSFPVSVQVRGRIVFGFKAGEDEYFNVELWAPGTAVPDGRAIRTITATPDRINLPAEAGNFGTKNDKSGFKNNTDFRHAPELNEVERIMWSSSGAFGNEGALLLLCKEEQEATSAANLNNPAITMLRSDLRAFVSRPEYRDYPWRAEWISKLQDNSAQAFQQIQASICRLRSLKAKPKIKTIGGVTYTGKMITVAPGPAWAVTAFIGRE
ncbi:hypothetical protein OC861_006288 [Tilletia horrida]|nr:hypothetical protein OC861_006288 [Tilletia horrida]